MESRDETEREWSTVEVMQEVNEKLSAYVGDLEQRNQELERLRGLGTLLQSCLTVEETHTVIARTVPKLFYAESGAVYLFTSQHPSSAPVAAWGDLIPSGTLTPSTAGWELVQERSYADDGRSFPVLCPDGEQPNKDTCLCAPMVGQQETLGLLYIQLSASLSNQNESARQRLIECKRQLAVTTAETIALYLTNIKQREKLYRQSIHDPLTGLLNRRPMHEFLEREVLRATRKMRPLGIIMADVDHFKVINDTCGHEAGDAVLRGIGLFFQKHIRGWDFACRYGGDEFLLVLTEASLEHVKQRAEQFCREAGLLEIHYRGRLLDPITLSLGVAVYPEHGKTVQELLLSADASLYQAKAAGRNRIAAKREHTIASPARQL
ncbi:MAG: sensor domain-containing diguanylate cyclase [Nitrospirota bacterium]